MPKGRRVTVTGQNVSTRRLRNMARRAEDLRPAWPKVGDYLSDTMTKQFRSEGRTLGGKKWTPLKPSYAARKARTGYFGGILTRTGDLQREFTSRPMAVERYFRHSAEFGSDSQLARWMAHGTRRRRMIAQQPRKNGRFAPYRPGTKMIGQQIVPPRPILYSTPVVRKRISGIVRRHILGSPTMVVRDLD